MTVAVFIFIKRAALYSDAVTFLRKKPQSTALKLTTVDPCKKHINLCSVNTCEIRKPCKACATASYRKTPVAKVTLNRKKSNFPTLQFL